MDQATGITIVAEIEVVHPAPSESAAAEAATDGNEAEGEQS